MLTKKEIHEARTCDLIDSLCFACWREYDRACTQGKRAKANKDREIGWIKADHFPPDGHHQPYQ
ncbi:MAG: hypothetical protein BWY31_03453 [Lentisphaerae bacterium ADurb.Bin242]|nr:MAG: hypothetical protein BWY31_03453 [Lentisphaerae bacterium ADurb.Bin242]